MQRPHRARRYATAEPISNDEVNVFAQLLEEGIEPTEVVAVVGIAHDHKGSLRLLYACKEDGAVSTLGYLNDARPVLSCDFGRAICAAIIGDQNLANNASSLEVGKRLIDANAQGLCLIEARHENRELKRGRSKGLQFVGPVPIGGDFTHALLPSIDIFQQLVCSERRPHIGRMPSSCLG
jgi:hypothetical protein